MSGRDDMYFPPPPPPVMPVLLNSIPPINPISACGFITVPVSVIPCGFQHPEQELFEATRLLWERERSEYPPEVICYNHIQPILQDGPKCGLVALSMASTLTRQPLSVEQLFWKAVNRGFSHHGEMFSVDNMAALAAETLQDSCQQVEVLNRGLGHDMTYILGHLAHGAILLVPYDADANHAPCLRRGHKAHWAAVCGAVRLDSSAVYVVARQGKSRRLALWSYEELRLSNENLIELDPKEPVRKTKQRVERWNPRELATDPHNGALATGSSTQDPVQVAASAPLGPDHVKKQDKRISHLCKEKQIF